VVWQLTPAEIVRVAKARVEKERQVFKRGITLQWLNAKLQRAKTIPKLEKLTGENKPKTFREIVSAIRSKPSA